MRYFVILILAFFCKNSLACTSFVLKNNNNDILLCWNFDWYDGSGYVIANNKGVTKNAIHFDNHDKPISWISKYGSITFNQFGIELPYAGINETGLSITTMAVDKMDYPSGDDRPYLNESQWIQYLLDNCATIEDVIKTELTIRVKKMAIPIHHLVCDKSGNCLIIEYVGGKIKFSKYKDCPIQILENDLYQKSLNSYKLDSINMSCKSRFSKAKYCIDNIPSNTSNNLLVQHGFNILDIVLQPYFTKWQVIFDVKNQIVYFKKPTTIIKSSSSHPIRIGGGKIQLNLNKIGFIASDKALGSSVYSVDIDSFKIFKSIFDKEKLFNELDWYKKKGFMLDISKKDMEQYIEITKDL